MLSSKYRSRAKLETHASLQRGLPGTVDDTFPPHSILSDPILTRVILSVLKALNFMLWILLHRKDLATMQQDA